MTDRYRRGRIASLVLVAFASLAAYVAVLAIWTDRQVLNTENWTESSSRILESPAVRERVGTVLVDRLYANVDVETQLATALPDRLDPLAGPAAGALRGLAEQAAREMLARPRAQGAWEQANRTAHELLIRTLEGGGPVVGTEEGAVILDLQALLTELDERLGVGGRLAGRLPDQATQLTLMESDQLAAAQDLFKLLEALPVVAVVLSLGLFGAALLIAPGRRRRTVLVYGAGLVAAGGLALATASILGDAIVAGLVRTEAGVPAARDVWTVATELLDEAAAATIGYGALLLLGGWLAGPSAPARGLRRAGAPYLREPVQAYAGFATLAALVVLWWAPTPATRSPLTAIVLVLLAAGGFEALRRQACREFPDAERRPLASELRARIERVVGRRRAEPSAQGSIEQLERLARLRADGVLDDREFNAEKSRILERSGAPVG